MLMKPAREGRATQRARTLARAAFSTPATRRRVTAVFVCVLVFLVALNGLTYINTSRLIANSDWVLHTLRVMNGLDSLALRIADAEQAVDSYLISPGEAHRKRFQLAADAVVTRLGELEQLTAPDPFRGSIAALHEPIARALASCEKAMALREQANMPGYAVQEMASATAEARGRLIRLRQEESLGLRQRTATADTASQRLTFWLVAGSLLNGAVLLVIYRRLVRELAARARSEARLSDLTSALEIANSDLKVSNEHLAQASRRKSEFVSRLSHELRTPLNAICGYSDLLAEESMGPLNTGQHRYLGHVRNGAAHLLGLVNELLDLARIESGRVELRLESVAVCEILPEVIATVHPMVQAKKIAVNGQVDPGIIVWADRIRLRQVLLNLLGNAAKFTPEGGDISVAAFREAGQVVLSVSDTGIGIPPEARESVFEDFYQVRASANDGGGTGLGLSIAKQLVLRHGGRIWVEGEPGCGSCFRFTLPAYDPAQNGGKRALQDGQDDFGHENYPGRGRRLGEPQADPGHSGHPTVRDCRSLRREGSA